MSEERFNELSAKLDGVANETRTLLYRQDKFENRLDQSDAKLDGIDKKIDRISDQLSILSKQFGSVITKVIENDERLEVVESRLTDLEANVH